MKHFTIIACAAVATLAIGLQQAKADEGIRAVRVQSKASIWMDSQTYPNVTVYYMCDSLIDRTEDLLKKLGATNVHVSCLGDGGGFNQPSYAPTVNVTFTAVRLPGHGMTGENTLAKWQTVSLHDFSDCDTVRQLLVGLVPALEVQGLNAKSCTESNSSYRFELQTLVAK